MNTISYLLERAVSHHTPPKYTIPKEITLSDDLTIYDSDFIHSVSQPQWVECFGIYKTTESGRRKIIDAEGKEISVQVCPYFQKHVLLLPYVSYRVAKIFDQNIKTTCPSVWLYEKDYGLVGDYIFTGSTSWLASAQEQYREGETSYGYHIGLDGAPAYDSRFKKVGDFEGVGQKTLKPLRELHGGNHNFFEGAHPIGLTGTGSPYSRDPLFYATIHYDSYRARATTFDSLDVWINTSGEIISRIKE